jgi:rRNA maturation endonuclease Nob1
MFSAGASNKEDNSNKMKECVYCGTLVKNDATNCDSCGGKKFKKHKY